MLLNSSDFPPENYTALTAQNVTNSNETALDEGPHWTIASYFTITVQVSALLINGSLVILFAWNRSLLTAFTIYVLNLCIANIFSSLFFDSLHLIDYLYSPSDLEGVNWWLGDSWCTMYQYSEWLLSGSMCNAHALIALNRFWAVTFPNSYRLKQTKQAAVAICVVKWLYMHLCIMPGTDSPPEWQTATELLIFDVPLVIIVGVLPVVYYKNS